MAKRGRKRKPGNREPNGRIQRKPQASLHDYGTDFSRMKHSVYGTDGTDAIGRAFHHGLLGPDALNLKTAARAVFRAYWPMMGVGIEKSCLGSERGSGGGSDGILSPDTQERLKAREDWIEDTTSTVNAMGRDTRRAFDGLCIDIHPDAGPQWLDRLIHAKQVGLAPMECDAACLALALKALAIIARSPS